MIVIDKTLTATVVKLNKRMDEVDDLYISNLCDNINIRVNRDQHTGRNNIILMEGKKVRITVEVIE